MFFGVMQYKAYMPEWTKWVVVGFACWRLLADAVMTITRIHYNGRISLVDCHNLCETSVYGHGLEYRLWLYDQHMIKMMFKFFHLCLKMIAWQIKRLNLTILTIFLSKFSGQNVKSPKFPVLLQQKSSRLCHQMSKIIFI